MRSRPLLLLGLLAAAAAVLRRQRGAASSAGAPAALSSGTGTGTPAAHDDVQDHAAEDHTGHADGPMSLPVDATPMEVAQAVVREHGTHPPAASS